MYLGYDKVHIAIGFAEMLLFGTTRIDSPTPKESDGSDLIILGQSQVLEHSGSQRQTALELDAAQTAYFRQHGMDTGVS
jgi:hypothetical protein